MTMSSSKPPPQSRGSSQSRAFPTPRPSIPSPRGWASPPARASLSRERVRYADVRVDVPGDGPYSPENILQYLNPPIQSPNLMSMSSNGTPGMSPNRGWRPSSPYGFIPIPKDDRSPARFTPPASPYDFLKASPSPSMMITVASETLETPSMTLDSPHAMNHAAFLPAMESFTDSFQVQGMHPVTGNMDIPEVGDVSPLLRVAKCPVERDNESPAVYAFDYDAGQIARKPAATAAAETKKASVEVELAAPLMSTVRTPQDADGARNPSDSSERDCKRVKLDNIPVDTVDVPLDYTSQRSTIGHQTWRQDEIRGPRRSISEGEAKELIKKHREELVKRGYTREPVFLVKDGNTRAEKGSPLYIWTRNGKRFRYRRASLAAIQHAVNQNSGNGSSKRTSFADVIKQCEDKLIALDEKQVETGDDAAVLQTTLLALKKEPFYGKDYSSMLQIERVREKSLINMLTRMMQELESPILQESTNVTASDTDNQIGRKEEESSLNKG